MSGIAVTKLTSLDGSRQSRGCAVDDACITFPTDGASLAIYGPEVARAAGLTEDDSWSFQYGEIQLCGTAW